MAKYQIDFKVDANRARRTIEELQESISEVGKEFVSAEIGSKRFVASASQISGLQKELKDARNAVVDIDKAYRDLNKAVEANFNAYVQAGSAAESNHK